MESGRWTKNSTRGLDDIISCVRIEEISVFFVNSLEIKEGAGRSHKENEFTSHWEGNAP